VKEAMEGDALRIAYDAIMEEEDGVDYITLGPLTNLSALITRFPDVVGRLRQVITVAGGSNVWLITKTDPARLLEIIAESLV